MARPPKPPPAMRLLRERALLLTLLLLALLLGPVVGGQTAWIHSHGEAEGHVHLLPAQTASAGLADRIEWHEAQHDGEDDAHHDDHGPAHPGLLVDVPPFVAASTRAASTAERMGSSCLPATPACTWRVLAAASVHRPELCRSGWPPQRGERSGVAALLRSSHAILI